MTAFDELLDIAHRVVWASVATVDRAHLDHSPYVSCSYWDPAHDVVVAECRATWEDDPAARDRVWRCFRDAPAPLSYDFAQIFPGGPQSADAGFLRLDPWRIRTQRVAAGGEPARWAAAA